MLEWLFASTSRSLDESPFCFTWQFTSLTVADVSLADTSLECKDGSKTIIRLTPLLSEMHPSKYDTLGFFLLFLTGDSLVTTPCTAAHLLSHTSETFH